MYKYSICPFLHESLYYTRNYLLHIVFFLNSYFAYTSMILYSYIEFLGLNLSITNKYTRNRISLLCVRIILLARRVSHSCGLLAADKCGLLASAISSTYLTFGRDFSCAGCLSTPTLSERFSSRMCHVVRRRPVVGRERFRVANQTSIWVQIWYALAVHI